MTEQAGMKDIAARYIHGLASKEEFLAVRLAEIDLTVSCKGIEGCDAFVRGKLRDGFWALDRLDRGDLFWEGTNKMPTLYKLPDYARYQIRSGNDLVEAAWLAIACHIVNWRLPIEPDAWRILKQHDCLDLSFLVRSAWNAAVDWGVEESSAAFVVLARKLNLGPMLDGELNELAKASPESRKWVRAVRKQLSPS